MGHPEVAATPEAGRVRPTGAFACPHLEAGFRHRHLPHDLAVARAVVLVGMVAAGGFVVFDVAFFPPGPRLALLVAVRAVVVAASVVALRMLRGATPARLDRTLTAWLALLGAFVLVASALWPAGNAGGGILIVLMVVLTYAVVPLSVGRVAAVQVSFSVGCVGVMAWVNPGRDADLPAMVASGLVIANVLGVVTARRLHRRQRELYLALVQKGELADGLEKALAEIRTLRGLFRVCAWCKGVHTDAGWQQLEDYVKANSYAEFTHGICPGCSAVHFAGLEPGGSQCGSQPGLAATEVR